MSKINVYVLRHGQTDMNVAQKWQGSGSDCLLNETGKTQALNLGETIKHKYIRRFYCSPLLRAVQTANIVASKNFTFAPITILKDLRECDFGDFEDLVKKLEYCILNPKMVDEKKKNCYEESFKYSSKECINKMIGYMEN